MKSSGPGNWQEGNSMWEFSLGGKKGWSWSCWSCPYASQMLRGMRRCRSWEGGGAALPQLFLFPQTPGTAHPRKSIPATPRSERKIIGKTGDAPGGTHSPWSSGAAFPALGEAHPQWDQYPALWLLGSLKTENWGSAPKCWLLTGSTRALPRGWINISLF